MDKYEYKFSYFLTVKYVMGITSFTVREFTGNFGYLK